MYGLKNTKENRLKVQQHSFEYLEKEGYEKEIYKGLTIFTRSKYYGANLHFELKIYRDTVSEAIVNYYFNDMSRRQRGIDEAKASYDRRLAYKASQVKTKSSTAQCADAIRAELKEKFTGVKFSVRSSIFAGGDSVDIDWTDGPTRDQVENVICKYQYGHFDGMNDIYEYSNCRKDLPQAKYVMTSRQMSKETEAACQADGEKLFERGFEDCHTAENVIYRIFYNSSIPVGAKVTGIVDTDEYLNYTHIYHKIAFDLPERETESKPEIKPAEHGKIEIVEYSEKAIAVIGDTKPVKDLLKELRGMFNYHLSCGAGWIFPTSRLVEVKAALNIE